MTHSHHPDAISILERLKKEQITALYHFTSVENLPHICRRQALCSKQTQENEGYWPPPIPGGNGLSHNLDRYNGNWDKVSLSFTPFTPMAYHKKKDMHLCFFIVKLEVATWLNVIFTDSNAASTNTQKREEGLQGLDLVNFNAIRSIPRPGDREGWVRPVQAEILVPDFIPFSQVTNVVFVSRASQLHAERICDSMQHPSFIVKDSLFTDSPRATSRAISFPFIDHLALTSTKIDRNMLYLICPQKNKISKEAFTNIYLTTTVQAMVSTKINIYLHPINRSRNVQDAIFTEELNRPDCYLIQKDINITSLPVANYIIEIFLGNVCRASITFELSL